MPLTVYRPRFEFVGAKRVTAGDALEFTVVANTPASGVTLSYSAVGLPAGAMFDAATRAFKWTPRAGQFGVHRVTFIVNDGALPESISVAITVVASGKR